MNTLIASLWSAQGSFTPLESALIVPTLFGLNIIILWTTWYSQQHSILEYGYPRVKAKTLKKFLKGQSIYQRVMLTQICSQSKRKGPFLLLCVSINFLNCIAAIASTVGLVAAVLTGGDGWAMTLLLFPPISVLLLSAALHFIPDLICLPSERRRYSKRKR